MSLFPAPRRLCAPSFVLLMASLALSLLAAPDAHAGSYNTTFSGGSVTITGYNAASPPSFSNGYDYNDYVSASASAYQGNTPLDCSVLVDQSSSLTATITWVPAAGVPNDLPPTAAIIMQYSLAGGGVSTQSAGGTGSGTADCGLPGEVNTTSTIAPNCTTVSSKATYYSAQSGLGSSFSLTCKPVATFTGNGGTTSHSNVTGGASVQYQAVAYPVTISLGGTTPDSSGNWNILVGQGCTARLAVGNDGYNNPFAGTLSNFRWNVSGTTFESWSPTAPTNSQASYLQGGPIPATNPTQWCWNDPNPATETIKCTVTVTPPTGQGSPFDLTVTAPKPVSVQLPQWTATGTGGYMQVNNFDPATGLDYSLYAGPGNADQLGGMNFAATSNTPPLFGQGSLELVQLVTPSLSYTTNAKPPVVHTDPEQSQGLDVHYPKSSNGASGEGGMTYLANDSPGIDLTAYNAGAASEKHQFVDYLLYKPPGGNSQWITLAQFNWSINGTATLPGTGNWADYVKQNGSDSAGTVTPSAKTPFTSVYGPDFFVSWTRINVFPTTF